MVPHIEQAIPAVPAVLVYIRYLSGIQYLYAFFSDVDGGVDIPVMSAVTHRTFPSADMKILVLFLYMSAYMALL